MFRMIMVIILVVVLGIVLVLGTTLLKIGGGAAVNYGKSQVGAH